MAESKTRNKLIDLHNSLFASLEALDDAETPEELEKEILRARSKVMVAEQIISNGHLVLKAATAINETFSSATKLPDIFGVSVPALDCKDSK